MAMDMKSIIIINHISHLLILMINQIRTTEGNVWGLIWFNMLWNRDVNKYRVILKHAI